MDVAYKEKIDRYIEEHADAMFQDLADLIAIESVRGEPEPDAPYGRGPKRALDHMLKLAASYGFETKNCENQLGYATIGSADKYICAISHLDVVPPGNDWDSDPYTLTEREGYFIGRGVMDDKGPAIATLYALRFLKDSGIPLRYETRAIFGTNEESGMDDVRYFIDKYPAPAVSFTPDANFPVSFAEKGVCRGFITSGQILENILDFRGGVAKNAVADLAEATVRCQGELSPAENIEVERAGDGLWHITAHGVSKHACTPQRSVNAIGVLARYLLANDIPGAGEKRFLEFLLPMLSEIHGESYGLVRRDDVFPGSLTLIGGTMEVSDGRLVQSFDCRYVTGMSSEEVIGQLAACAGDIAEVTLFEDEPVYNIGPDNPAIQLCYELCREYRDDGRAPYASVGGTYARHMPNAFAFGPQYFKPDAPDFVGAIHAKNEGIGKEQLKLAAKIYTAALLALQELDY